MIFIAEQTTEPQSVLISQVIDAGSSLESKSKSKLYTKSDKCRRRKASTGGNERTLPDRDGLDGYEECKGGPVASDNDDCNDKEGWTVKKGRRRQDPLYSRKTFTTKPKTIIANPNPYGVIEEEETTEVTKATRTV
jgi:hypothetical protein